MRDKESIAIDVDETLAELYWKWLQYYNAIFEDDLQPEDIKSWDIAQYAKEDAGKPLMNILNTHKFYRDLGVKPDAKRVLKKLNQQYDIYIVTDYFTRMSFKSKYDWIIENFPFLDREQLVFTGDKSIINADYMIDDAVHFLKDFKGKKILFDAPHNQEESGYFRVFNWRHIEQIFLKDVCMTCRAPLFNEVQKGGFCGLECEERYMKEFT